MIKNISLRNFRKHENLDIDLGEGLQVLRGSNEAGKTTTLEALAYALFGSKALRNSLADVVTWGKAEKELRVEVTLEVEGRAYTFTRAKSGAEVILDGKVFVTGQTEVSNFAASLLGADANSAAHLMMSGQGGLRGALEQGPKATSALIENLANLDIIETILEAAAAKLQLGSTAVLDDRLKAADLALAELVVVAEPDKVAHDQAVKVLVEQLNKVSAEAVKLEAVRDAAAKAFMDEDAKQKQLAVLTRDAQRLLDTLPLIRQQLEEATAAALVEVRDPAPIEAEIREAEQYDSACKAWALYQVLPVFAPPMQRDAYVAEYKRCKDTEKALQGAYNRELTQVKVLESQRSTSTVCPTCGQDTAHLPGRAEKAAQIEADIAKAKANIKALEAQDAENDAELSVLAKYKEADEAIVAAARKIDSKYITLDDGVIPMAVHHTSDMLVIGPKPDVSALRVQLAEIKAAISARDKAAGRYESLTIQFNNQVAHVGKVQADAAALGAASVEAFNALNMAFIDAGAALARAAGEAADLGFKIDELNKAFEAAAKVYAESVAKGEALRATVTQIQTDIEAITFNNALLRKIRAARPIIASKLWGMVLSTVSVMFSKMRGESSIVTKEKDGFMCNGRPIESLSGSCLDILALSIRCALVRTFLPTCRFMVLDEVAAACDQSRTESLIAFISTVGIDQILLVTHEDVSSSVAAGVIQL